MDIKKAAVKIIKLLEDRAWWQAGADAEDVDDRKDILKAIEEIIWDTHDP